MADTEPVYIDPSSEGLVSGTDEVSGPVGTRSSCDVGRLIVGIEPSSTGGSALYRCTRSWSTLGTEFISQRLLRCAAGSLTRLRALGSRSGCWSATSAAGTAVLASGGACWTRRIFIACV